MIAVFDAYGTLWDVSAIETACAQVVGPGTRGDSGTCGAKSRWTMRFCARSWTATPPLRN